VCVCKTCPAKLDSFGAYAPLIVPFLPSSVGVDVYGLVHKVTKSLQATYMQPLYIVLTNMKCAPRTFNKWRNGPGLLLCLVGEGE